MYDTELMQTDPPLSAIEAHFLNDHLTSKLVDINCEACGDEKEERH